jgi:hypothetical protein
VSAGLRDAEMRSSFHAEARRTAEGAEHCYCNSNRSHNPKRNYNSNRNYSHNRNVFSRGGAEARGAAENSQDSLPGRAASADAPLLSSQDLKALRVRREDPCA